MLHNSLSLRLSALVSLLILSSCFPAHVPESPKNTSLARSIVAQAYKGESSVPMSGVQNVTYLLSLIEQQYYRPVETALLAEKAQVFLTEKSDSENPDSAEAEISRLDGARKAILAGLDRHSVYYNKEEYSTFKRALNGGFVGIGVRIVTHDLGAFADPIPDSPASKAGMQKGDIIIRAGAQRFEGMPIHEVVDVLRGKIGTNVTVGVIRDYGLDTEVILDFSLRRALVQSPSVVANVQNSSGYIGVTKFAKDTGDLIKAAINDFEKQNLNGYIIDLRGNLGGLLQPAITITDFFVDQGIVVSVKSRNSEERYSAHQYTTLTNRPLVVLIDQFTASSAEILAIALSDHQRATLVGEASFGKGTVQTLFSLQNGAGAKLTTARYYSPNGTSFVDKGITPDTVVPDDHSTEIDETLAAAFAHLQSL